MYEQILNGIGEYLAVSSEHNFFGIAGIERFHVPPYSQVKICAIHGYRLGGTPNL